MQKMKQVPMCIGKVFRDFPGGPDMVVIPPGKYEMGGANGDSGERPVHFVSIPHAIAVGIYPVTFEEWDLCYSEGGTDYRPEASPRNPKVADGIWSRGRRPVINVDWNDAKGFARWLASKTGKDYRLPSEAEWEYFARAGTTSEYCFGDTLAGRNLALCQDGVTPPPKNTFPVGSFPSNAFGIFDVHGNVWEWVEDSRNNDTYEGAPKDGSAWVEQQQAFRILRGGSWHDVSKDLRSAYRKWSTNGYRFNGGTLGFRVVRDLTPDEMSTSLEKLRRPLTKADIEGCIALESLQAGVLSSLPGDHFAIISMEFCDRGKITWFLRNCVADVSDSASSIKARRANTTQTLRSCSTTIHLAYRAFEKLGISPIGFEQCFVDGMSASRPLLNDPPQETFQVPYDTTDLDALFVLTARDGISLQKSIDRLTALGKEATCNFLRVDIGQRRQNSQKLTIGPLGFADGISQPKFFSKSLSKGINCQKWDPSAFPGLAIIKDPNCKMGGLGSYLVYRKYSVDAEIFDSNIDALFAKFDGERTKQELQALFFGRYKDGTPLANYGQPVPGSEVNDFKFSDDPLGARCPFHAHIRKMNPRGEHLGNIEAERRIVRRGMAFWRDHASAVRHSVQGQDEVPAGLHFLCFQSSIENQFEFLQSTWANDDTFQFGHFPGVDAVIGQRAPVSMDEDYVVEQTRVMRWPRQWDESEDKVEFDTKSFVSLLGGEYLFTPSIYWLRSVGMTE